MAVLHGRSRELELLLTLLLLWYVCGYHWSADKTCILNCHLFCVDATKYKMNRRQPGLNILKVVSCNVKIPTFCYVHYCQEIQQKQNASILCIDSQYIHKHDCFPRFPAGDWVFLADTTVLFELCRITSDSFLQAFLRFLSQAHLHVQLNIRMAYSPGLIHTTVSLNHEGETAVSGSVVARHHRICVPFCFVLYHRLDKEGLSYLT